MSVCACGCGRSGGLHDHHVIYQQELRWWSERDGTRFRRLRKDRRNIVLLAFGCHADHHSGKARLRLGQLPDSVFEFAGETMGAGPAYEYLRRRYAGDDPRLEALVSDG